ncbi:uncharacterized protein [Coffea arabica]|uniref:HPP transmembrane region domain-containing protein n=1 Tax=Coffea arabica TaxID=13443 RepID=A0A6P6XET0_COFAR|nr:uncharacterized protein LOC113742190 [Coffea arabica]
MGLQNYLLKPPAPVSSSAPPLNSQLIVHSCSNIYSCKSNKKQTKLCNLVTSLGLHSHDGKRFTSVRRKGELRIVASSSSSSSNVPAPFWDSWAPQKGTQAPSLSDIFWPSAGAFAAMAILGKIDQILAPKGISMTIAPLGAVCAVLFATPSAPGARKYNLFMAQIGCAAIGVIAFTVFGPGWLARSSGLAAAIAFMICTRAVHPPAAGLPLLFIDAPKLHRLNFWYALFPGAAACILLCLIQEMVCYLKDNFKF